MVIFHPFNHRSQSSDRSINSHANIIQRNTAEKIFEYNEEAKGFRYPWFAENCEGEETSQRGVEEYFG